ncbi:universal stress protein [Actinocrispum wychmicini]|uniref:Nucleotide-binding universal stress UspA family protein n=1 Tax=Actinocrispum wychmicini TaxID=1213861 RepID=A0A4R2JX50_9PSEU|nr:universal stress protein [Actinocrispum wychmicini]TCO61958.1 nucleotide-binding universal stress UspA family protein [Actinocrispum wychmicini]
MKTQKIIVGVDGSPASHAALRWATDLAATTGAVVAAVDVQRRTPALMPAASMALLPYGTPPETPRETRAERLHAIVAENGVLGSVTQACVRHAPCPVVIIPAQGR